MLRQLVTRRPVLERRAALDALLKKRDRRPAGLLVGSTTEFDAFNMRLLRDEYTAKGWKDSDSPWSDAFISEDHCRAGTEAWASRFVDRYRLCPYSRHRSVSVDGLCAFTS